MGGEDLQRVALADGVAHLHADAAALQAFFDHAHEGAVLKVDAVLRRVALHLAEIEAGGVSPVADRVQLPAERLKVLRRGVSAQDTVDAPPVGVGDGGHVEGGLHAALDLQRGHTGVDDLVHKVDAVQVEGAQQGGAPLVLLDGEELAGPLLLHQVVAPAAGLSAGAPVGAAARQERADHAPARPRHAHGTVHEGLQLETGGGPGPKLGDLLQRHLPAQHHAGGAHVPVGPGGGVVQAVGLGADVDVQPWGRSAHHGDGPQVRHDGGVRADAEQGLGVVPQGVQLVVGGEGVHGDVKLPAILVDAAGGLGEGVQCEAHVAGTQLQARAAYVDGVGAEAQRGIQALQIPGRGEQLRSCGHGFSSSS